MKEIEVLMELLDTKKNSLNKISTFGKYSTNRVVDYYYYPSNKINSITHFPKECLRIRSKNNTCFLAYKKDNYKNKIWQYSDEYEVKIDNFSKTKKIIESIGFQKIVEIKNTKYKLEINNYEIVIEDVKDLGLFLEVEILNPTKEKIKTQKEKIRQFIKELKLKTGKELNIGKPELMFNKIKSTI